jgi:L-threonylcarbamoyladenylate synthase
VEECAHLNDTARSLAERFLPGPLTLVLPAKEGMPLDVMLNGAIGIRIPNDPFCEALAKAYGHPFTTTSANRAGMAVPEDVDGIIREFGREIHRIALFVDDGPRTARLPSTVVSCISETPYILREGALSRAELGL